MWRNDFPHPLEVDDICICIVWAIWWHCPSHRVGVTAVGAHGHTERETRDQSRWCRNTALSLASPFNSLYLKNYSEGKLNI